ncbi:hypothetical protein [Breoghania sp. L-A4]|uniref:hypothetical protein n=1 Tax=Breoghania sp. L-A4 TaxID=2304600 RepID=UPI000E35DA40|nr:hypothetical protein [Breoghania sp. L-A4]AXS40942.1 hypothetical protein D1F64_14030 [Breoghania sp. L-A4]
MEIRSELIDRMQAGEVHTREGLLRRGWSLEATLPAAAEAEALGDVLEPGTEIFLSSLPRTALDGQIEAVKAIRDAGLEPVPHLAARNFTSEEDLDSFLKATQPRKCLVIAGDLNAPRGPFSDSMALLKSDVLLRAGLESVAVGGYPEGHPHVGEDDVARQLKEKIGLIEGRGWQPSLVTQFCFDGEKILHWLGWLRGIDAHLPVSLGLAGPTQAAKLLKIALRCWVDLPMRSVRAAPQLLRGVSAEPIIAALEAGLKAQHESGPVRLHFYSFGGLERTGRWAQALSQARAQADLAG